MHHCAKKIRFFLILLVIKLFAVSALLMKLNQGEKRVSYHQAIKAFNAYLISKTKKKDLPISQHELEKLMTAGRVIITAYGNRLTKNEFNKIKRQLRNYLKIRFSGYYKKSLKTALSSINFRLAKHAIKARLLDHLGRRMNITNPRYQNALWHTVRGFVMHQLYEKSYFDESSGGLVVDQIDINNIFSNTKKLLNSYRKQLPPQAYNHTKPQAPQLTDAKAKSFKKRHKKHRRHLISREKAVKFVTQIIQRSGVPTEEYDKLANDIMNKVDAHLQNGKIDHYTMKKLAHDEIKKHESQLAKLACSICKAKITSGPNRKVFSCGHTYHRTCLYKKYGTVEFLKGWRGSKKCPKCVKT